MARCGLVGLRLLGLRNIIVMDSLKPFLPAVFGWAWAALGGIACTCTVVGILLASLQDHSTPEEAPPETQLPSTAAYSIIQDVDTSKRSEATTPLAESSMLLLATASFPIYATTNDDVEVAVCMDPHEEPSTTTTTTTSETMEHALQNHDQLQDAAPRDNTISSKRAKTALDFYYGYGMVILNVVLDTYFSVLAKQHGSQFTTWEINLIRFGFA
jgi:hypothetical protein